MKTIKIRALWFKPCTPAMKTVDVTDEFFNQIPRGISETQLAALLELKPERRNVRHFQIQYEGEIIYSTPNHSACTYPCDDKPW